MSIIYSADNILEILNHNETFIKQLNTRVDECFENNYTGGCVRLYFRLARYYEEVGGSRTLEIPLIIRPKYWSIDKPNTIMVLSIPILDKYYQLMISGLNHEEYEICDGIMECLLRLLNHYELTNL